MNKGFYMPKKDARVCNPKTARNEQTKVDFFSETDQTDYRNMWRGTHSCLDGLQKGWEINLWGFLSALRIFPYSSIDTFYLLCPHCTEKCRGKMKPWRDLKFKASSPYLSCNNMFGFELHYFVTAVCEQSIVKILKI